MRRRVEPHHGIRDEIDFRRDVPALEVPVLLVEGSYAFPGRYDLAVEWLGAGRALPIP